MKFIAWFLGLSGLLALAGVIMSAYVFYGEPLPEAKLSRLRSGMRESEVIAVLGPPTSRTQNFPKEKQSLNYLCYEKPLKWNLILVCFDTDGRYTMYLRD